MAPDLERTVTFLFTDLEGSTQLWDREPWAMRAAIAEHNDILSEVFDAHGAHLVKNTGDGALAAFDLVGQGIGAALDAQRRLDARPHADVAPLRARMAVHVARLDDVETGCHHIDGDYFGPALNRCARLMATAHGGQVVVSEAAAPAARQAGYELRDLGRHRLRDLSSREHVFQVLHPALWADFPPLRSVDAFPGNLPKQGTSFVGRDEELHRVAALVDEHRVVTLAGVGGVGKTRLAVHAAARLIDRFEDGAWLVDLTPIADGSLVPATVAGELRVRERHGEGITDTLCTYLEDRSLLLVVDNCEHVVDAASAVVEAIVRRAPGVRVIATSREPLRIRGEQTWRVPVLEVPDDPARLDPAEAATCEAVRLFVDRARTADPAFELDAGSVRSVAELCRRLDGIPLAIELAAVRTAAMSPDEILRRLDARFRLLTVGGRTDAEHHQTLRGAIDWSHDLLVGPERALFRRLSVFAGGWALDDAEAVASGDDLPADEVLDLLAGLVRKSMVVVAKAAGATRYRLLESLREYAAERLVEAGEHDALRGRHAHHFYEATTGLDADLRGPGQAAAYATLHAELDNVRAAFDWFAAADQPGPLARLVRVLRTYLAEHRPTEGFLRALEAAALAEHEDPRVLAGVLADAAWLGYVGERDEAESLARQSLATTDAAGLPPDPEALLPLGLVALYEGDLEQSLLHFERAASVARHEDDRFEIAAGLTGVCFLRSMLGDVDGAVEAGEEALSLGRELGYATQIAGSLAALGFALGAVDVDRSVALLEESLSLKDDTSYSAVARVLLANLYVLTGRPHQGLEGFCRVLQVHQTLGDTFFVPMSLEGLASVFGLLDRPEVAARTLGGAAAIRRKLGLPGLEIELALRAGAVAAVRGALDDEAYAAAEQAGERLSLDDTIELALREADDLRSVIDLRSRPSQAPSRPGGG